MNIDNVRNFPFPTPPKAENVKAAEKRLVQLGALKTIKIINTKSKVKIKQPKTRRQQFKCNYHSQFIFLINSNVFF